MSPATRPATTGPGPITAAYAYARHQPLVRVRRRGRPGGLRVRHLPPAGYLGANSRVESHARRKDNSNILDQRDEDVVDIDHALTRHCDELCPAGPITATVSGRTASKHAEWSGGPTANYTAALRLASTRTRRSTVTLSLACAGSGLAACQTAAFPSRSTACRRSSSENVAPGASIAGGTLLRRSRTGRTEDRHGSGHATTDSGVRKIEVMLDDQVVASVDYDRDWSRPLSEQKVGTCAYESWRACDAVTDSVTSA